MKGPVVCAKLPDWPERGQVVCELHEGSLENVQANQKLIAAAPELLEACQGILEYLNDENCGPILDSDDPESGIHEERAKLQAAIAKATGN